MAILPGLCEETLFRGAIQGTFEKRGVWKGVIYAAVLFAVYHLNPWNFIPAIALGVLLGLVTVRTNSILPAMVCHVSNNCMGVIMAFIYRGDENEAYLLLGALTVVFALAMWEFLYHTRRATWQPSPLAIAPAHLSRRLKKIAKYAAALLAVLMITAFVGFRAFFRGYRISRGLLLNLLFHTGRLGSLWLSYSLSLVLRSGLLLGRPTNTTEIGVSVAIRLGCSSNGGGVQVDSIRPRVATFMPIIPIFFSSATGNRCSMKLY